MSVVGDLQETREITDNENVDEGATSRHELRQRDSVIVDEGARPPQDLPIRSEGTPESSSIKVHRQECTLAEERLGTFVPAGSGTCGCGDDVVRGGGGGGDGGGGGGAKLKRFPAPSQTLGRQTWSVRKPHEPSPPAASPRRQGLRLSTLSAYSSTRAQPTPAKWNNSVKPSPIKSASRPDDSSKEKRRVRTPPSQSIRQGVPVVVRRSGTPSG